jgi:hypothetical protein
VPKKPRTIPSFDFQWYQPHGQLLNFSQEGVSNLMNVLTFKAEKLTVLSGVLVLAIGMYSDGAAFGQTAPPSASAPPGSLSANCSYGSQAYALAGDYNEAIALIRQKCKRGDTVLIPGKNAAMVGQFCDFSRAVVIVGDFVVCVLTTERPRR